MTLGSTQSGGGAVIKRSFDIMFAALSLLLTAPLLAVIAWLICLETRGPVLYAPTMIGKSGKPFRLLRFRTMRLAPPGSPDSHPAWTRVGRAIRNLSLDHLPTLVNVLTGDLSLIRPRPMGPDWVDLHDPAWQTYFSVRPGLLSYAILKLGRTYGHTEEGNLLLKRDLELEFIARQSLRFDLKLLFQFARAHLLSRGNIKMRGAPIP